MPARMTFSRNHRHRGARGQNRAMHQRARSQKGTEQALHHGLLDRLVQSKAVLHAPQEEIVRSTRQRHPLALILLDLDNFKEYKTGTATLRRSGPEARGKAIQRSIREGVDSGYRYEVMNCHHPHRFRHSNRRRDWQACSAGDQRQCGTESKPGVCRLQRRHEPYGLRETGGRKPLQVQDRR